jgi:hypothetical protein
MLLVEDQFENAKSSMVPSGQPFTLAEKAAHLQFESGFRAA